jgi:hypothetical protein
LAKRVHIPTHSNEHASLGQQITKQDMVTTVLAIAPDATQSQRAECNPEGRCLLSRSPNSYNQKSDEEKVRSEVFSLCGVVTLTFRVLTLFAVTKCYSYSKIGLQLIVVPPGEYPINRLTDPNPRLSH